MSSRGKKKTTMAKLSREARQRERRLEKAVRREARREAALEPEPRFVVDPPAADPPVDDQLTRPAT